MMTLIGCLEKYGRDQTMCVDEINKFNQCYVTFRDNQREVKRKKKRGILPSGQYAQFTGEQMNNHLKKFPSSNRTKQAYVYPEFLPTRNKRE